MTEKRKIPRWLIHTAAWLLYFSIDVIGIAVLPPEYKSLVAGICVPALICSVALFYYNYSLLVEKFWTKRRYAGFLLLNMVALAVCLVFLFESYMVVYERFAHFSDVPEWFDKGFSLVLSVSYLPSGMFIIVISSLFKTSKFWNQSQVRLKELEHERTKAELAELKSQINPHFLFNSLNAIYALIDMDSDKAQEATHALSNLLRYVLNEKNEDMVPLADELKFTRDYIELMSLRFSSDMLSLKVEMPDAPDGGKIAPMVLMTLIENAFKHGISNAEPSFILILMHIDDGRLVATISNSVFPKSGDDRREGGIGLDNLSRRLELLYGDEAKMDVIMEEGAYTTKLEIPLK